MRLIRPLAVAALAVLGACTDSPAPRPLPPTIEDTCNAARYGDLIGQDATALEKVLILGMVRVIRPGDMVTMDYQPQRINFGIGADNRVKDISCG